MKKGKQTNTILTYSMRDQKKKKKTNKKTPTD